MTRMASSPDAGPSGGDPLLMRGQMVTTHIGDLE